ncbi:MAG: TetR/AcrR family transcriptional regulator [Halomonadaceae bacterium]|nr:MAG: TetR/AcrR family transcriptional regulator [Halomonadaceae bacterium]
MAGPMNDASVPPANHRDRLLAGLAETLERKSFRQITLSDIAEAARVSRRTFYEHFQNKEACFLALCEDVGRHVMGAIQRAGTADKSWSEQVKWTTHAYLSVVEARPLLMKALYIELATLGEVGMNMRRQVVEQFARYLQGQIEMQRQRGEPVMSLSLPMGVAIVAGINELILYRLGGDQTRSLLELAVDAEELILRVSRE